jgi:RimJ/RimL family protein N-acetyltransferase
MNSYKVLSRQSYIKNEYSIVPIRMDDRYLIMKWRNEQLFHLRQKKKLIPKEQDDYFKNVVASLFDEREPSQILFSFLYKGVCVGYGGLVHISWVDKNAEISFVMNTEMEKDYFSIFWKTYLHLIEDVAFVELKLNKLFTYAFDLRPHLYKVLEDCDYIKEATLKNHCFFNNKFIDVIVHSKFENYYGIEFRRAVPNDVDIFFQWVNDADVRKFSIKSDEIKWDEHLKWFNRKITNNQTQVYIFHKEGLPLGQVRLDFVNDYWEIDYSIDNKYRGQGLGYFILNKIFLLNKDIPLKAKVKPENIGSIKIFKKFGFVVSNDHDSEKLNLIVFQNK